VFLRCKLKCFLYKSKIFYCQQQIVCIGFGMRSGQFPLLFATSTTMEAFSLCCLVSWLAPTIERHAYKQSHRPCRNAGGADKPFRVPDVVSKQTRIALDPPSGCVCLRDDLALGCACVYPQSKQLCMINANHTKADALRSCDFT
jgi:hypothetical protein